MLIVGPFAKWLHTLNPIDVNTDGVSLGSEI